MRYAETVILKDGVELLVRNAVASDARALRDIMQRTHAETDYLLSCPDEQSVDDEQEARSLAETERSDNEVELVAVLDGRIVGSAGIAAVGGRCKVVHRARFGISILKEHWGMGIGRVLTDTCIDCARRAGYTQLELEVVADNERALSLYRRAGFEEYGRNPRGYRSTASGYQELVHMKLEL
ncbi:GNAT family N-acetyltransferase [uncultured Actinomyces sp.]|uniref:GNAT family N-acetyltransferase n=1 Tax=uncultured Actinomyces sp. TaxID=249061 RepID=UPI0025FF85AD|nr:GNAT family N-acetyltransferase [uncultured Actinomyces sp.]